MRHLDSKRTGSLLRLVRISKAMELSVDTVDLVEQVLFDSLGLISTTTKTKQHEETVRRLIENGESWGKLKPVLLDWWRVAPSPILAGKIVELTYLNAGTTEISDILNVISKKSEGFWKEVHPAVRTQIISEMPADNMKSVVSYLAQHALEYWLLPIERLTAFATLVKAKMQSETFELYSKFESTLIDACINFGVKVSVPKGWVYLNAAKAAVDCGFKGEAIKYLKNILPDDKFYQTAAKLVLSLEADEKNFLKSEIASHLLGLDSWAEREEALRVYLGRVRTDEGNSFEIIPILNTIFAKSSIISVQDPVTLNKYVKLCLEHVDLVNVIPNIIAPIKHNILNFHARAIDGAIWQNVLSPEFEAIGDNWRAVALVHRFVIGGPRYESSLFKAYDIFKPDQDQNQFPIGLDFELLKEAAVSHIAKCGYLSIDEKELMVAQLNLTNEDDNVKIRQCEEYIARIERPTYQTLERLLRIAKKKESPSLIQSVVTCFSKHAYLRNSDLKTLWNLSTAYKQYDNAWRVATVLESRAALPTAIHYPWTVSGENRKVYPVSQIDDADLELCLDGIDEMSSRACMALLSIGHKIPELVACIDEKLPVYRLQTPPEGSHEFSVLKEVSKISWFKIPSKRAGRGSNKTIGTEIPAFAQVLPANRWSSLVSLLMDSLGVSSINADFAKLARYAETVAASIGTRSSQRISKTAASKWVKSLSPVERTAWHDLYNILRKVDPVKLEASVMKVVVRMATLLIPAHFEALTSLQNMKCSLSYLRDLENFILSEEYTQYRSKYNFISKVPVPDDITVLD